MFRIRKGGNGQVVFTLSGRMAADVILEIQEELRKVTRARSIVLDLKNVTLVDQAVVEFLAHCKAEKITLQRCPAYIRKWMEQIKEQAISIKH